MKLKSAIFMVVAAVSVSAQAAPTVTQIGDVTVLGKSYDVSLLADLSYDSQSFNNLNPSITFTNYSDASAAVAALLGKFGADYDWNPTCSCGNGFRIPFAVSSTTYDYVTEYEGGTWGPFTKLRTDGNAFSFAQFTAAPVPEPESYAMLLAGLGIMSAVARRRKQK